MKNKSVVWLQGSGSEQPDPVAALLSHSRAQSQKPSKKSSEPLEWLRALNWAWGAGSWDLAAPALDPLPSQCLPCTSTAVSSALMSLQLTLLRSLLPWLSSAFRSTASFHLLPEAGESLLFLKHKTLGAPFPPFPEHMLQGCTSEQSTGLREGEELKRRKNCGGKYWKWRVASRQILHVHTFVISFFASKSRAAVADYN